MARTTNKVKFIHTAYDFLLHDLLHYMQTVWNMNCWRTGYCTQTFCLVKLFKFFVCCIIIIFFIYQVLVNKDDYYNKLLYSLHWKMIAIITIVVLLEFCTFGIITNFMCTPFSLHKLTWARCCCSGCWGRTDGRGDVGALTVQPTMALTGHGVRRQYDDARNSLSRRTHQVFNSQVRRNSTTAL